ncbi:putative aldouronate transport system permease protein [Propionibacteriaceae bacterium ES.041]|uniref:carbohydrate ABC transporter permease n=1 Tax=Enemella evansiae TaxID=2016499 RepID=UPI000B969500|nr:carbohydrate ABC transporter permease [Enemella evansiae]OYN94440.1 ABC transporter permease [Enemella evansiae]PFG66472.1 putative aldouronate transport system permease protein [Propionibacteriaceae bacterium ES.041]
MERPSIIGQGLKGLVLLAVCFAVIYPFVLVIGTSLSTQEEIAAKNGFVLFPSRPTLAAYELIFAGGIVTDALVRSLAITLVGTAVSVTLTVMMAYGLSRRGLLGGGFFLMTALLTMLFTPGIIPTFLVVKELGLLNSYAALILPTAVSAFNLVIMRSFIMNLPTELTEAARLDGAGDLRILWNLVLPLSKGVIAVIGLFYAVGYWNAFFNAMLYVNSDKWPLAMVLRQYVLLGSSLENTTEIGAPSQAIQMAVVVISVVPILCVYPFLQKYFTKGVLTGAIKG